MRASAPLPFEYQVERVRERADYFHCYLADQPEYLVPERLFPLEPSNEQAKRLIVSPDIWFSWKEPTPAEFSDCLPLPEKFLAAPGVVWVKCPISGIPRPFWAGPWFREKLSRLTRNAPPRGLSPQQERILSSAGILVDSDGEPDRAQAWKQSLHDSAEGFHRDGFARLPSLVQSFHLGALRRYYRRLLRLGGMVLGDESSPLRYVAYNESVAGFFHWHFADVVSAVAGVRVKPTFSYVASYQGGASLPIHTDRAQCEFAISMLIDYLPDLTEQSPWPLAFATECGSRRVWQCLGDAVLYRGTSVPHSRGMLTETATSTSMLFYYVNESFSGSLD